jgi:hypothetical protein
VAGLALNLSCDTWKRGELSAAFCLSLSRSFEVGLGAILCWGRVLAVKLEFGRESWSFAEGHEFHQATTLHDTPTYPYPLVHHKPRM